MQRRVVVAISERAVNTTSVEKYFSEKERSIFWQKFAKSVWESNETACHWAGSIAINDVRTIKQSVKCDDYQALNWC